jgi:hypothetical protein
VGEEGRTAKQTDIVKKIGNADFSSVHKPMLRAIEMGEIAHFHAGKNSPHYYWLPDMPELAKGAEGLRVIDGGKTSGAADPDSNTTTGSPAQTLVDDESEPLFS